MQEHTWESLFPRSIIDAASEAAVSCASVCRAIPTSARAKDGASLMPSPTFGEKKKRGKKKEEY